MDISNEIVQEEIETLPGHVIGIQKTDYIVESNDISKPQPFDSCEVKDNIADRLRNDRYDSYHLNDSYLQIPLKTSNRLIDVILYNGHLFGIPFFDCKDNTKLPKEYLNFFLSWKQLYARYSMIIETGGLRNSGEIVLTIGPLYMDLKTPKLSNSELPKIQMSKVREINAELKSFDEDLGTWTIGSYLDEFKTAVVLAAERTMRHIVNHDVRNILLTYVKKSLINSSSEDNFLSPFSLPLNL